LHGLAPWLDKVLCLSIMACWPADLLRPWDAASALTLRRLSMILRRDQAPERGYPDPAQRLAAAGRRERIY